MVEEFDIVSGEFEGNFFTQQKSVLTTSEWNALKKEHDINLYRGELKNISKETVYEPEEFRNRESLLLHNVTNVQFHSKNSAGENTSKIYDFEQLLIRDAEIKDSWELNGKTYGIITGKIIGKVQKRNSNFDASNPPSQNDNEIPKVKPEQRFNNPPPSRQEINDYVRRGGGYLTGCLSNIWRLLFALILLIILFWLLKGCIGDYSKSEDCCLEKDKLESENEDLKRKLSRVKTKLEEAKKKLLELEEENERYRELAERRRNRGGKIGELTFTLMWDTEDDLDLSVTDPTGQKIYHKFKKSQSGGELDIDANRCEEDDLNCDISSTPIENVFWRNNSPTGNYSIQVDFFNMNNPRSNLDEVPFYLEVLTDKGVKTLRGIVSKENPKVTFDYYFINNQE
jgi:hypothetical protein